jgi:hypothetical protein
VKLYFSYAMTGAPAHWESFAREVVEGLRAAGHEVYFPAEHFALGSGAPPRDVYNGDMDAVCDSRALVALLEVPSTGMGMEVEAAISMGHLVFGCAKQGVTVSDFVVGALERSKDKLLRYTTVSDLIFQLVRELESFE